jgi:hypothetical protein
VIDYSSNEKSIFGFSQVGAIAFKSLKPINLKNRLVQNILSPEHCMNFAYLQDELPGIYLDKSVTTNWRCDSYSRNKDGSDVYSLIFNPQKEVYYLVYSWNFG